jgi:poly(3-hydroxybutyrate) depolymerase
MPDSVMTLFPPLLNQLEALKIPLKASLACTEWQMKTVSTGFGLFNNHHSLVGNTGRYWKALFPFLNQRAIEALLQVCHDGPQRLLDTIEGALLESLSDFRQAREGELEFLDLFTAQRPDQDWTVEYDPSNVLLELPGCRLLDISSARRHKLKNYTVVFAPRAGHHSNIAERVALFLRDRGLSRMAVVEQKCAEDIPLYVDSKRHYEDFEGQVDQYRRMLQHLKNITGRPPHLVAICQPGPLLITTLILHPQLGRTFGSAGSPMHTEAQGGFLTDFARLAGSHAIDIMLALFGRRIGSDRPGFGRKSYDGRLQVLGFYLLGFDQHLKNLRNLLNDLKNGNRDAAERQKAFYLWYNTVHHFPAGFIRDTYKKIFIENALIKGSLRIANRTVGIEDYPASVPAWALGGKKDNIAPVLQAVGHMERIGSVPEKNKLTLQCDAGHMGLFRSRNVLQRYYTKIAEFMLAHSDRS